MMWGRGRRGCGRRWRVDLQLIERPLVGSQAVWAWGGGEKVAKLIDLPVSPRSCLQGNVAFSMADSEVTLYCRAGV